MKELVVEVPYKHEVRYPWNQETVKMFRFDEADVDLLTAGKTLFRGPNGEETAFSLEDEDAA